MHDTPMWPTSQSQRAGGGVAFELVEKPGFVLKLVEFAPTWARFETHSAPP